MIKSEGLPLLSHFQGKDELSPEDALWGILGVRKKGHLSLWGLALKWKLSCWPAAGQAWLLRAKHSSKGKDLGLSGHRQGGGLAEKSHRSGAGYCSGTAEKETGWRLGLSFLGRDKQSNFPESFYWWKCYHARFYRMQRISVKVLTLLFHLLSNSMRAFLLTLRKTWRRSWPWLAFLDSTSSLGKWTKHYLDVYRASVPKGLQNPGQVLVGEEGYGSFVKRGTKHSGAWPHA